MNIKKKIGDFFTEEVTENEPEVAENVEEKKKTISIYERKTKTKEVTANIIIVEPRDYNEVLDIANKLKDGNAVMVNLRKLSPQFKQRMIDFLQGVAYGLNGITKHVDVATILCTPANVGVDGDIFEDNESTDY